MSANGHGIIIFVEEGKYMNLLKKIYAFHFVKNEVWLTFKEFILFKVFQKKWRERNVENGTVAENIFPFEKVQVGKGTYGSLRVLTFDNPNEQLKIGNYCSIAGNVTFILRGRT